MSVGGEKRRLSHNLQKSFDVLADLITDPRIVAGVNLSGSTDRDERGCPPCSHAQAICASGDASEMCICFRSRFTRDSPPPSLNPQSCHGGNFMGSITNVVV